MRAVVFILKLVLKIAAAPVVLALTLFTWVCFGPVSYTHLTTLAAQKQQAIRDAFKDWIWRDPERRRALVHQYNEEMNSTRPREYDGSHTVSYTHLKKHSFPNHLYRLNRRSIIWTNTPCRTLC